MNEPCPSQAAGLSLGQAVERERPLQLVGVINAYCAVLAQRAGFSALYLSGAGVANASYGLPDLGMTQLGEVLEDVRRITGACPLPLLVDADTGWGHPLAVARTSRELSRAGAAGMHLEDQHEAKRCGHRPDKVLVVTGQMVERIKAAVDGRSADRFVVMARTDAAAGEGLEAAIDRAGQYADAGAQMIFAEALGDLDQFCRFTEAVGVPVLANITEFGSTPLYTVEELGGVGIRLVLYPLSAFRAMSDAAQRVYETIRRQGTQKQVVSMMQSRDELYRVLDYRRWEQKMDQLVAKEVENGA